MIQQVWTVGAQVVILYILIGVGFLCGKARLFAQETAAGLTSFTLYVVTPCAVIDSFCRPFDPALLKGMLIVMGGALASYALNIGLGYLFIRDRDASVRRVLRFGAAFGNCVYMGLPLLNALYGSIGVFYGAAYVMTFVLMTWTYGLVAMSGDIREIALKKLPTNPGILGSAIGLIVFALSLSLPKVVHDPIRYLAALNTPVPMVIVGYYLSQIDLSAIWNRAGYYVTAAIRLLITPLLLMPLLLALGVRGELLVCIVASTCVPVAAVTTMLCVRYGQDADSSAAVIALTTLFSIVTMPLVIGLAQHLS